MTNPNEELVEQMAKTMDRKIPYWKCQAQAEVMLGVILSDISKVAMVCPECQGSGHIRTEVYDNALHGWVARSKPCSWCKEGVVPRNEMKGVSDGRN